MDDQEREGVDSARCCRSSTRVCSVGRHRVDPNLADVRALRFRWRDLLDRKAPAQDVLDAMADCMAALPA